MGRGRAWQGEKNVGSGGKEFEVVHSKIRKLKEQRRKEETK
jgi:hypothetical protein